MSAENKPWNVTEIRGLACLLLVAYHVVGLPDTGMRVDDDSVYRYAVSSFNLIRMPLFMFLSGLVYAYRPADPNGLPTFLWKKVRRLMVPFVVASTLFYLMLNSIKFAEHGVDQPMLWEIYVFPYAHFWYLQVLLIIVTVVGSLDALRLIRNPMGFLVLFIGAVVACMTFRVDFNIFAINQAVLLLPHFLLGVAVNRFRDLLKARWALPIVVVGFIIGFCFQQASIFHIINAEYDWNSWVALLSGMGGAVLLLYFMPPNWSLRWIGRRSYTIYLYHPMFTAATRIALSRLGFDDLLVFILSMIVGLIGPVAIEALARTRFITRVALIGQT